MSLLDRILRPSRTASAHCDGPCGVYDSASARIAAEAVLSMAKKLVDLGDGNDLASENTRSRFIAIKEEQAQLAKQELLILWTDYFKPPHLEANPGLHDTFWNAAKLCSQNKVEVNVEAAQALVDTIGEIHNIFWASKSRDDVPFYTAG
ncbi:MAG: superoxide dismutase, Ni [Dehalococcoidia bacterium]|nr:superoxide dismutase, Ni [Dehalococcoidia bacterium]MYA52829.1 superoxide dismutase, Ni [Dehalococcoidia bacterium]